MKTPTILLVLFTLVLPVQAGLVAYWPFNDVSSLGNDAAGGSTLTANGGASHATATGFNQQLNVTWGANGDCVRAQRD